MKKFALCVLQFETNFSADICNTPYKFGAKNKQNRTRVLKVTVK